MTEYERAVLSSIEASLQRSSPGLTRRFEVFGEDGIRPRTWVSLAVAWAAAVVVLATFTFSLPFAFLGLAVMGVALALLVAFECPRALRSRARSLTRLAP